MQDWADDAVHATAHSARLGRDARLKHVVVTLGGDLVRLTNVTRFTGAGGEVESLGLYFADAGQHQEHRLFVDHAVPNCTSRVTYKGALQGEDAHTVWIGDVLIRADAEGTDTYELNRNLVLTDGARADSVPNLEIETGEIVGAGHASATGRFDDEQLFYLQARGIPEIEARRLVVRGFFAELVQRIGVPDVEQRLMASIEAELARPSAWRAATRADAAAEARSRHERRACAAARRPARRRRRQRDRRRRPGRGRPRRGGPRPRHRRHVHAMPRCPCRRARSRTARSSAGSTAPASICAPASPRRSRRSGPCPSTP